MANNLEQYNRRHKLKRSTISSEVPTIPSGTTAVDVNDHTEGGWLVTDIYHGEMFINTADNRAWFRGDAGIVELSSVSGYSSFLNLTDTPVTYLGDNGKMLKVNSTGNGIEFVDDTHITLLSDLNDTPTGLTYDNKVLVGSDTGPQFNYKDYISTFEGLTDVDNYSGKSGNIYVVNITEEGLQSIDPTLLFVELSGNQIVSGIKTFNDDIIFNDAVYINNDLIINSNIINDIIIDIDLIGALNTNISSTLAMKTYIDNTIITAVGGDYVNRTGNVTITGIKTFTNTTLFNDDLIINANITVGDVNQNISGVHYFGDISTDGSYRVFINPLGFLETQKRESGIWVFKTQI